MKRARLKLPDPDDLAYRRWVIGLEPPEMHREVLARLRGRRVLVGEAVRLWLDRNGCPAGDPFEVIPPGHLPLMLQRLTITTPFFSGGMGLLPLLPFGSLVERVPQAAAPHVPSARQSDMRAVIDEFQRRLLARCFTPLFSDALRLAEYEWLLRTLQGMREPRVPFRRTLQRRLRHGLTLSLNGRRYALPRGWGERCSATSPPEEVTRLLLAFRWACDAQAVKECVARWRKEWRVARAWDAWWQWLQAHPERLAEMASLLEPLQMQISASRVS